MSTTISPSARGKSWVFSVFVLCIFLGAMLALSFKTQRQAASEGFPQRLPALRTEFRNIKEDNEKLRRDLAYYKAREEELARRLASGTSGSKALQQALDEAKMLAGTIAVHGPGVIVTIDDSPKLDPAETRQEVIEQYMVHDYDIRNVVNELFTGGAEAIAVNEQRIIATSSIRCVGPPVLVNTIRCQPPYVVKAIGKPDDLEKSLELQGGAVDGLFVLDMIKIEKKPDVLVPAYEGSTRFNLARPVRRHTGG